MPGEVVEEGSILRRLHVRHSNTELWSEGRAKEFLKTVTTSPIKRSAERIDFG